jgi:hypothetical protein
VGCGWLLRRQSRPTALSRAGADRSRPIIRDAGSSVIVAEIVRGRAGGLIVRLQSLGARLTF